MTSATLFLILFMPLSLLHITAHLPHALQMFTPVSNSYSQVGFLETILYCGFSLDKDELKTALFPFFNVGRDEPHAIDLGFSGGAVWK